MGQTFFYSLLADTTPAAGGGGIEQLLVIFAPFGLVFYFLVIRPENKRKKQKESLLAALKTKDKVVTIGGLHGTVAEIDNDDVVLLVDQKKDVKLRFRRSAIESIEQQEEKK